MLDFNFKTWFGFKLKNLGGKSKSNSLSANFQSFSRIIVKRAKLGLSLLNRLQYIPICKILPNDRPHEYSWFCLESFITVFWIYCCFAQGRFCSKAKVANHALQFTHPLIGLEANLISEMSLVRESIVVWFSTHLLLFLSQNPVSSIAVPLLFSCPPPGGKLTQWQCHRLTLLTDWLIHWLQNNAIHIFFGESYALFTCETFVLPTSIQIFFPQSTMVVTAFAIHAIFETSFLLWLLWKLKKLWKLILLTAFAILVMSLSLLPYPRSAFKLIQKYKSTKIQIDTFANFVMSLNPLPSPRSAFSLSLVFGGVGCARSKVSRSSTQKMVSSTFCYWNILKAFEIIKPAGLWHKQIFRPHDFFHRRRPWWLFSRVSPCLEEESSSRLASLTCCPMSTRLFPTFKKDVLTRVVPRCSSAR